MQNIKHETCQKVHVLRQNTYICIMCVTVRKHLSVWTSDCILDRYIHSLGLVLNRMSLCVCVYDSLCARGETNTYKHIRLSAQFSWSIYPKYNHWFEQRKKNYVSFFTFTSFGLTKYHASEKVEKKMSAKQQKLLLELSHFDALSSMIGVWVLKMWSLWVENFSKSSSNKTSTILCHSKYRFKRLKTIGQRCLGWVRALFQICVCLHM